jgi:hypothetical protein
MKKLMFLIIAAAPLGAQVQQEAATWAPPAGWTVSTDKAANVADTKFQTMGSGYHVTSGPAAIYFNQANQGTGPFTANASFGVRSGGSGGHFEGYGLFIGGADLNDAAKQQYFYFLVRGDGKYFVAHRAGAEVHKIVDWTENAAVRKQSEQGAVSQVLSFQVTADSVHMSANGTRVHSFAKSALHGFNTDGQVGLRVNHNLNLHISAFEVKK